MVERGEFARGSALLRRVLDTCDQTGWHICMPSSLVFWREVWPGLDNSMRRSPR
jgi:hypothetical protein